MGRVAEIQVHWRKIVDSDPRTLKRREQYPYIAADVHGVVLIFDLAVTEPGIDGVDAGLGAQKSHHDVGTTAEGYQFPPREPEGRLKRHAQHSRSLQIVFADPIQVVFKGSAEI